MPLDYEITIALRYPICRARCLLCFCCLLQHLPHSLPFAGNRLADNAAGGNFLEPRHCQLVYRALVGFHILETALLAFSRWIFLCRRIYSGGQTPDFCVGSAGVPLGAGLSIFSYLVENNLPPLQGIPRNRGLQSAQGEATLKMLLLPFGKAD